MTTRTANIVGIVAVTGFIILLFLLPRAALGHEAKSGWTYPPECCGDGDCDEASAAIRNQDGSLTVTTKHGTATFPAKYPYRQSPDGKIHGCFVGARLYCLFLDTGT